MYIAPEPGLKNPAPALKPLRQLLRTLFSVMAVFLLCNHPLQAKSIKGHFTSYDAVAASHRIKTPGIPDLSKSTITIVIDNSIADGVAQNRIIIHLVDSDGNPVPNYNFSYKYVPGSGVTIGVKTDVFGDGYIDLGSPLVGQIFVTVTVPGATNGTVFPAQTLTYVAYVPDLTVSTTHIIASKDGAKADNSETDCVKVFVTDAGGNPVPNQDVLFTMTGTASPSAPETHKTATDGTYTMCYTSAVTGSISVVATIGGVAIKNNATGGTSVPLTFVPGDPSPAQSTFTVEHNHEIADGVKEDKVQVVLRDANGNIIPNKTVTFTIISGDGSPSTQTITTNASGIAEAYYTSTKAGNVEVQASAGGIILSPATQTIDFIAGAIDMSKTDIFLGENFHVANGIEENCVYVLVVDKFGNPVPGALVQFRRSNSNVAWNGSNFVTTDATGKANICFHSTKSGDFEIWADVNGVFILDGVNPKKVITTFIAGPPDVSHSATIFEWVINGAVADNSDINRAHVKVVDAFGNPVPNANVTFEIVSGTATPATITVKTDVVGDAFTNYRSSVPGSVILRAFVETDLIAKQVEIIFVKKGPSVGPGASEIIIDGSNTAIADGVQTVCVKAIIRDVDGNLVPAQKVQFFMTPANATFEGPTTVTTDALGEARICMHSIKAGNVSITATVKGLTIVNGSPQIAKFIADAPDPTNPGTKFTIIQNDQIANGSDQDIAQVVLLDKNGNPVPNIDVTFTIASGTASPSTTVTVTTNALGIAQSPYTSTVAGTVVLGAVYDVSSIETDMGTQPMRFIVDAPSTGSPGTYIETLLNPATVVADGLTDNCVKVHVADANGNVIANQEVTITFTGTATAMPPAAPYKTAADGTVSVCYISTTAGVVNVIAKIGADVVKTQTGDPSVDLTFTADAPDPANPGAKFTIIQNDQKANNTDEDIAQVVLVDKNGNPVPGVEVTFTIQSGTASPSTVVKVTTNALGIAEAPYKSTVAGAVMLNAVYGTTATDMGDQEMRFVADAPSTGTPGTYIETVLNPATVEADGLTDNCVKVHVADANGNVIANQEVTITFTGTANVATPPYYTGADGTVTVCYRSTTAGVVTVTAQIGVDIINTTSGDPSVDLTFTAGAVDPANPGSKFTIRVNDQKANNTDEDIAQVVLVDKNGNPVPGVEVTFTIKSGTASPSTIVKVTTNAQGIAEAPYKSTVAGTVTLNAVYGTTATDMGDQPMRFVADAPSTGTPNSFIAYVDATDITAIADGNDPNLVYAHITDANGNPVANVEVIFIMTGAINGNTSSAPMKTDALGNVQHSMATTVPGEVLVTATVNGLPVNGGPLKVYFIVGTPDNNNPKTKLVVTKPLGAADDVDLNTIVAHVHDKVDNPVPGQLVTITIATGTATAVSLTGMTDAKGEVIFELHSAIVGDVTVTATINNTMPIKFGSPALVSFTKDPDVTNPLTYIVTVNDNAIADGIVTNSVMAHIVDAGGTAIPDEEVTFFIISGDPSASINISKINTNAQGEATVLVTSKKPGFVFLGAIVNGDTIRFGSPARVRFVLEDVYVPRVFTPNGDGTNDVLKPIVVGVFNFSFFNVYNRWGNLVYTTRDINAGWDGRLKGVLQPNETYLWLVGGTDKDGKQIQKKGMTSLVR